MGEVHDKMPETADRIIDDDGVGASTPRQGADETLSVRQTIRLTFVNNLCAHYRVKTFEILARLYNTDFLFYSTGKEWYWPQHHGVRAGNFRHTYLRGFQLGRRTRVVPSLLTNLWRGNYDVIVKCINGRFALPLTYLIARLRRKPFVLWTGIWMSLQTRFHRLAFPLTLWIYRHADAIVVYGDHVKRYLVSLKVAPEKIFVAAHAVDNASYNRPVCEPEKALLREKLQLGNSKIVLYLGRLEEEKGLDYLVGAFPLLNVDDTVLLVVGDGSLREKLGAAVQEHGLQDKTRFVGYVSPEDAVIYYAIAEVFVLPSVTMPTGKETWGLVVNEAMNQGVPVVATEAVGAAAGGLVQSGVNGFIVPERDSAALAQAIARLLTDAELRAQMNQNACRIIATWDNDRMVQGFQQAVEYALQQRSR
jgi:glycosyltransferase involved in cell wall biosynthesis